MPRIAGASSPSLSPPAAAPAEKPPHRRVSAVEAAARPPHNGLIENGFPSWARLSGQPAANGPDGAQTAAEAFFAAGAGLALIDPVFRQDPPFAGVLRQRLALRAAATSAKILRLREDEADLRDAEHLALPGADPGRAGRLHRLWRALSRQTPRLDGDAIASALPLLDAPADVDAKALGDALRAGAAKASSPLAAAAQAAALVMQALPEAMAAEAEILALWAADLALAQSLGWARPAALLATRISHPSLRRGANGRRPRPGEPHWPESLARAYALAAGDAHALAADLARRCEKLLLAAPQLRAKGAARAIALLLADDAVTPARAAQTTALSDRAARRLCDRLIELGAIRELSGRTTFRLYGL